MSDIASIHIHPTYAASLMERLSEHRDELVRILRFVLDCFGPTLPRTMTAPPHAITTLTRLIEELQSIEFTISQDLGEIQRFAIDFLEMSKRIHESIWPRLALDLEHPNEVTGY